MAEIYGTRWTSSYGADPSSGAGRTWAKGLAGVGVVRLGEGLAACLAAADPWPPTLPEFRARCLGVPTLAQVSNEIRSNGDRSAFATLVWQKLDAHRYRNASSDVADRIVRDAYDLARDHVMRGGALPAPSFGALEAPSTTLAVSDRESARAAAERAMAELGWGSESAQ